MSDLQIHTYGPAWAVTHHRTLVAFAVSETTAEALVQRLDAYPEDRWGDLTPCPFWPCLITSVRQYPDADMVVLGGADRAGWPVCMPLSAAEWDAFEARHPGRPMPFAARIDPASGLPELCSKVDQVPVQSPTQRRGAAL